MNSNVQARNSVIRMSTTGHTPRQASNTEGIANIISNDVTGNAKRLVIRKFIGNVRKWYQAAGAVKTWQEIANAAASQIFFIGVNPPSAVNQDFRTGKRNIIPPIAR